MSNVGIHGFEIPHHAMRPLRDQIIVRIPMPPKQIGSIVTPDSLRDLMVHNVIMGRIVALGPLAFCYKDKNGEYQTDSAKIGDWVSFRPFAGTMMQGGKMAITNGYRYISTFNDAIAVLAADDPAAPDLALVEWGDEERPKEPTTPVDVPSQPRSREILKVHS